VIVSASRRTDIPALYSEWLLNRLAEGYALVPHRFDPRRLWRIDLSAGNVDCLVLWTKNPAPMLGALSAVEDLGHRYYFQYTLTPYGPPVEPGVPPLESRLGTLEALSARLGPKRVVWRYDPVIVDRERPPSWHEDRFGAMAERLSPLVERVVISFVDPYRHQPFGPPPDGVRLAAAARLAAVARQFGLGLCACAESPDLAVFGISPAACVDAALVSEIIGRPVPSRKDRGQRPACGCSESRDIGAYDTCVQGCRYCYATTNPARAAARRAAHDPRSPVLTGRPRGDERIDDLKTTPQKPRLF
jgi:hypothetical protein